MIPPVSAAPSSRRRPAHLLPPLALPYRTDCVTAEPLAAPARAHRPSVVLVPVAADERSEQFLETVARLAETWDASLVLLHVYEPLAYAPAHVTPAIFRRLQDAAQHAAESRLERLRTRGSTHPRIRAARVVATPGRLEEEVPRVAQDLGADFVVVSTHGYSATRHWLVGSKAERILHRANCPVVVVPRVESGASVGAIPLPV